MSQSDIDSYYAHLRQRAKLYKKRLEAQRSRKLLSYQDELLFLGWKTLPREACRRASRALLVLCTYRTQKAIFHIYHV